MRERDGFWGHQPEPPQGKSRSNIYNFLFDKKNVSKFQEKIFSPHCENEHKETFRCEFFPLTNFWIQG